MKLTIAYCHGGMLHAAFAESVLQLMVHDRNQRGLINNVLSVPGLYVAPNRNGLTKTFMDRGDDVMLMLDSDIVFNPEDVYHLLDSMNEERQIMSGCYFSRFEDDRLRPVWVPMHNDMFELPEQPISEIRSCGGGFMAVTREVVLKMNEAYRADPYRWFGHDMAMIDAGPIRMGEDVTFCTRARRIGYRTFGNRTIALGHSKTHVETLEIYWRERTEQLANELARESLKIRAA